MTEICYPQSAGLLSVAQAQFNIQQVLQPIQGEVRLPLLQALGRVCSQAVTCPIAIPPQRNAAMDGYAYASSDQPPDQQAFSLKVVGTAWAGHPFDGPIDKQQCIRIFTGAVVPDFADSVVAQEQVQRQGDRIDCPPETQPYKNIRPAGSDVQANELLLAGPKKITASDLGLLAAAGIGEINVKRCLKIGFFSTGDELTPVGQPLQPGKIYDSNRYLLAGLLNDPNHQVTDLGVIPDDAQHIERTLQTAATEFDVLISTGGASVGDADFIQQTLSQCGQVNFWKIAIKPGKPLTFGKIKDCWFWGLPGNPVAVLVTYQQFVRPALEQMLGLLPLQPLSLKARSQTPLRKQAGRQEYQRGILTQNAAGEFLVSAANSQESHQQKIASQANCFIVLPADCQGIKAGEWVSVQPFETRLPVN